MAKSKKTKAKSKQHLVPKEVLERFKKEPGNGNHIRNWRLFRKLDTHEALAKLTAEHDPDGRGLDRVTICRLETGEARYNESHIRILSKALCVAPRDLIGTDPWNSGDIFMIYAGLTDADKQRATKLLIKLKR